MAASPFAQSKTFQPLKLLRLSPALPQMPMASSSTDFRPKNTQILAPHLQQTGNQKIRLPVHKSQWKSSFSATPSTQERILEQFPRFLEVKTNPASSQISTLPLNQTKIQLIPTLSLLEKPTDTITGAAKTQDGTIMTRKLETLQHNSKAEDQRGDPFQKQITNHGQELARER